MQFTIAGLVVTVALAALTGVLARRAGAAEATRSFENVARITAAALAPSLDAAPATPPQAQSALQSEMAALQRVGPVVGVTVRDASGRALWSDVPQQIGAVAPLDPARQQALQKGSVGSPVTAGGPRMGKLLETYVGVRDVHGVPLLVDVVARSDDTAIAAWQAWMNFAPAALIALLALQLVQVPLAWRLARRLQESEEAEDSLLQAAVQASDTERRRIAGQLHDHVVQDLTGLAYDLDAARLRNDSRPEESAQLIARTAGGLRRSIGDLRTVLASRMPSSLASDSLGPALEKLGDRTCASGARVRVRTRGREDVPPPVAVLLYRCAEEALRNVAAHSGASAVDVSVRTGHDGVTMVVEDNGRGFDAGQLQQRRAAGHLGLRALGDLLRDAGGSLTASSAPGQGTRLVVTLPLERPVVGTGGLR